MKQSTQVIIKLKQAMDLIEQAQELAADDEWIYGQCGFRLDDLNELVNELEETGEK